MNVRHALLAAAGAVMLAGCQTRHGCGRYDSANSPPPCCPNATVPVAPLLPAGQVPPPPPSSTPIQNNRPFSVNVPGGEF